MTAAVVSEELDEMAQRIQRMKHHAEQANEQVVNAME
jgi:hypothetical protein